MSVALADRSRIQKNLETEHKAKEKESADLTRLLRVLVHDICNPLAVIVGGATIGLNKCKDPKQQRIWQKVLKASNTIVDITNDVRAFEAVRSGKKQMDLEPVSLREVFDKAYFIFEDRMKEKSLKFFYDVVTSQQKLYVLAEPVSFSNNVINNLVSNAIKFSHEGDTIHMVAEEFGDHITIRIIDEGIGIPDELKKVIFDPNAETNRLGTNNEKGTGFGMPLVKTYVEHYHGKVRILTTAEQNKGTTVEVLLQKTQAGDKVA